MRPYCVFLTICCVTTFAADPLELPQDPVGQMPNGKYIAPNEHFPQRALPVYAAASAGAWVAVGTERGFLAVASSPAVTDLVLIDADPGVVSYNRSNVLLLRIARDREHYLELRLSPSAAAWKEAATAAGLDKEETQYLLERAKSWKENVSESRWFRPFHRAPRDWVGGKYRGMNYLYDDTLFERVQSMARNGNISVGHVDFNDPKAVLQVVQELARRKIPLSALDVSNAWWLKYTWHSTLVRLITHFDTIATPRSYLLTTGQTAGPTLGAVSLVRAALDRTSDPWTYQADTFERIRSFTSVNRFVWNFRLRWLAGIGLSNLRVLDVAESECAETAAGFTRR